MELQIRQSDYHGFAIILVNSRGEVIRCHETPCEAMLEEFTHVLAPLDRELWLDGYHRNDRPEMYGELVSVRSGGSITTARPDRWRAFIDEVRTVSLRDRRHHLRIAQEAMDRR